jgi:agmatine/peptidylarginine deiminase
MKTKLLVLSLLIFTASLLSAQQNKPDYRKLHYLSQEEMLLPLNTARDFIETDPPTGDIRNVAEFDQMQSVLVRYPFGIPMSLIKEMAEDLEVITLVANSSEQQTVENQYAAAGVNLANTSYLITPTDSYWVRDYGPWFVFDGNDDAGIMDFPYNRPRPNDNNVPAAVANYLGIDLYGMNVYHTGGNYMTTGMGQSASTDLVYDENPQLTEEQIADKFLSYLNVDPYHVTADPLDDYIKHIDCWGKYLSPGKVLIDQVPESDYRYDDYEAVANYFAGQTSSWGKPYEVVRIFTPGTYPYTPYSNSLILNDKVFVPITGSQYDSAALQVYEDAMPGYQVFGIMYNGWLNTDALHCRTKGVADIGMLYIDHMPLLGNVAYQENYELTAHIHACSGQPVYNDSVFIYYSFNGDAYQQSNMTFLGDDEWTGTISGVQPGDEVDYYLYAADWSGRRATNPYIGEADPHEFKPFGGGANQLEMNPDTILFMTNIDMTEGKILNIINISNSDVSISNITAEGSAFPWFVEEMPNLPYILEISDTLKLNILCNIPVELNRSFISDTMFISTPAKTYDQLLMIDDVLLDIKDKPIENFVVYPNPFVDNISFGFNANSGSSIKLKLFDISGRLVYNYEAIATNGKNTIYWDGTNNQGNSLSGGLYLFDLKVGDQSSTGKVLMQP